MKVLKKIDQKTRRRLLLLVSTVFVVSILSCQNNSKRSISPQNKEKSSINELELKVRKLEEVIKDNVLTKTNKENQKIPAGKIKSLTFRIGTEDDRLRIYWEDGSKSDLPCTKEQFIWACG